MSKVTIEIPPGCELVQTGEGKWEQRKIERGLPKTWEGFCETHPIEEDECFLSPFNGVSAFSEIPGFSSRSRSPLNRDILPNKETAEAFLALMQLIQLRNCYNGDWVPDWSNTAAKWVIAPCSDNVQIYCNGGSNRVLSFKTKEICGQFFENFRDLIETAKPLI